MVVKIDCLGDICPVPIIKLKNHLNNIQMGKPYMLVTDHSCTLKSVRDFCNNHKLYCESDEIINGVWEIIISNTPFR